MSSTDTEGLAEGLAARGREELVVRLREAYAKALGTHSDLVSFDSDQVEAMVQRSAADADGLQWRRALAGVAARELGIDLGSALTHPAVVRAHQLVGAPSYDSALTALAVPLPASVPEPTPAPAPSAPEPAASAPEPAASAPARASRTKKPRVGKAPVAAMPEPAEAEPDPAVAPAAALGLTVVDKAAGAEPAANLPEASPEPEPAAGGSEPEPVEPAAVVEAVETEPDPEPAAVVEAAETEPHPEPAADIEAAELEPEPGEPLEPVGTIPGIDDPTMAYDAIDLSELASADEDPAAQAEGEPEATAEPEAEPSDEVLAHRAADFAEEFMAGEPVAAGEQPPVSDDFTFEHDAVKPPGTAESTDGPADTGAAGGIVEFGAVHLGGVASLPSSEEIALRISEDGLDLLQDDGTIVGRLGWTDIAALEVTTPHGRRRRHNAPRLVVHTAGGSARFEVPGLSGEDLQDQVQPLMARFGQ